MKIGRQEVEGREAERKEEKSSFLRKQFSILSPYILRPEGLKSLSRNPQALRSITEKTSLLKGDSTPKLTL